MLVCHTLVLINKRYFSVNIKTQMNRIAYKLHTYKVNFETKRCKHFGYIHVS